MGAAEVSLSGFGRNEGIRAGPTYLCTPGNYDLDPKRLFEKAMGRETRYFDTRVGNLPKLVHTGLGMGITVKRAAGAGPQPSVGISEWSGLIMFDSGNIWV
jgi:hypothetical protein